MFEQNKNIIHKKVTKIQTLKSNKYVSFTERFKFHVKPQRHFKKTNTCHEFNFILPKHRNIKRKHEVQKYSYAFLKECYFPILCYIKTQSGTIIFHVKLPRIQFLSRVFQSLFVSPL